MPQGFYLCYSRTALRSVLLWSARTAHSCSLLVFRSLLNPVRHCRKLRCPPLQYDAYHRWRHSDSGLSMTEKAILSHAAYRKGLTPLFWCDAHLLCSFVVQRGSRKLVGFLQCLFSSKPNAVLTFGRVSMGEREDHIFSFGEFLLSNFALPFCYLVLLTSTLQPQQKQTLWLLTSFCKRLVSSGTKPLNIKGVLLQCWQ